MGCGKAAVAARSNTGGSTTVRRMKAEDRVRRSNHRMRRATPGAMERWNQASGEAEGYGPYKPIPPPKPSQQQQQQPQDRAECAPTPPPYRMPPLPVQPQQFQQHAASLPEGAGRGVGGVEAALPGAPEASPPLHTHSSKFPIEREVIVSSAEKASDTFKAKIPLIQDYGRRVAGAGGSNVGGVGMARGIVLGGGGPVAVAPDAPIKQVAWTEESAGKTGRKGTPHHHHHHHHVMSPANSAHVGVRGQQQQFQNQEGGVHNRQVRDEMSLHPYNGHLTGAVPRREWGHGPVKGDEMVTHGMSHSYSHSNHNASRDEPGNTRPQSSLIPNQGAYGSAPCNTETARYVQTQEEESKAGYSVNSDARQQDTGETSGSQTHVENTQPRMDFDPEGNVDRECEKIGGRLANQSTSKPFPARTYHQIKDMISSRFGGGSNKPKDGQLQASGDVESGMSRREGREREGVGNQGLNNSGCRPPVNVSDAMRSTPTRMSALQQSSRKSNNLGEREDVHHRGEVNQRDQYQPQSGKNDYDHRVEATPAIVTSMQGNKDGMGEQHGNRGETAQSMQQMYQQGMAPDADYGMSGGTIRKSGRREEMGSREMIDHGYASPQKGMMSRPSQQHPHSPQNKRKEDEEHQMQGTPMSQIEYSLGSMQIGEPTYYSTPVGGEQGKQNNSIFHAIYSPTGDSNHSTNLLMQHLRQQQGQANASGSSHNYGPQQIGHGCSNLSRGKEAVGIKSNSEEHDKGAEQQRQLGGPRSHVNEESGKSGNKEIRRGNTLPEEGEVHGPARGRQGAGDVRGNVGPKGEEVQSCYIYQETIVTVEGGSAGGSVGGGSSDYEKATHRSGRSTSTDSGRGTAGHGMAGSRKGGSHNPEGSDVQRDRMGGQSPEEVENTGPDTSTESEFAHPGSRHALYGLNGLNPANDSEWVDVVESELRQILDPKLHVGVGTAMSSGIANSTVSESMSMTPPLPPLSPGGSPPASPTCSPKDRGKNYKLSSSMPYINKPGQMEQKLQIGSHSHLQSHVNPGCHQMMSHSKGGSSARLQQALSHSGLSVASKGQQHGRQQRGGIRMNPSMPEAGMSGSRGGAWVGSGRINKGSSSDRARAALRKEQQMHGMGQNSVKTLLSNSVPLASFGAVPSFDNGDMTSTTTGLDLDSMLDGQTENTSDEDMSATIDTTDAQAIRRQLEGLENMYSEVLKLLGVKKHGTRYQPSDPRINKRRMYGSLSSIPSSVSSRPVRDKRRQDERKKVKDIKGINKRFQRLESHVVTLARSVAHLSSEMRTQHLMMQEMETIRGEIAQLRAQPIRSQSVPRLSAKAPLEKDSFCNNVPALTNPERVKKLTRFFGDEPPLLRIFLKKLGYEKYASVFEHERIGLVELPYLTEERLQKMGIPMGPRLRIIQEAQISFCQENMNVYVV